MSARDGTRRARVGFPPWIRAQRARREPGGGSRGWAEKEDKKSLRRTSVERLASSRVSSSTSFGVASLFANLIHAYR